MADVEVLRVPIAMNEQLKWLEEKGRVTMDVLKYMVYEAVEEGNEEWVAQRI
jgi:hypothetical protein